MIFTGNLRKIVINRLQELQKIRIAAMYEKDDNGDYRDISTALFFVEDAFFDPYIALACDVNISGFEFAQGMQELMDGELNQSWQHWKVLLNPSSRIVGFRYDYDPKHRVVIVKEDGSYERPFMSHALLSCIDIAAIGSLPEKSFHPVGIELKDEW